MRLELVSGFGVEWTRRADQKFQGRQVLLGHSGVEEHADDGGLDTGSLHAVRLYGVDEAVDGEPLEHHDAPGIVNTRDELTYPDAAELPVGELRRGIRRGRLSAGDAEYCPLEHGCLDRLSLRWASGAAGQNLKRHTGFDFRMPARFVATLQTFD